MEVKKVVFYIRGGGTHESGPCSLQDALQEVQDTMEVAKDYRYWRGVYIEFGRDDEPTSHKNARTLDRKSKR